MKKITDSSFGEEVIKSRDLALVDFWAEWCGPCRAMASVLEALDKEYDGRPVVIAKLNVDENPESARQFGIMSIPTLLFFKGGQVVDQIVGAVSREVLKSKIDAHL